MSSFPETNSRCLRVLMVHNRYLVKGGEDTSFEAEVELLRQGGHEVECYVRSNEEISQRGRFRTAIDTFSSSQSRREVGSILRANRFDVMHVQNFFPLISTSIYRAARDCGVAVVQHLRNYRSLCAGGLLMRNGQNCELCLGETVGWGAIRHRCYRGSAMGSAVVVGMNAWHRIQRTFVNGTDRFLVPSELVGRKFKEGGFPADRIVVKPDVVPDLSAHRAGDKVPRAIFVGRLSAEKGVRSLVEAWVREQLETPLAILGSGPLEGELRSRAARNPAISFLGQLPLKEACQAMAESELLLLPTECHETFGRTVLEAYAGATPVISSRGTAPGDLVVEGETGYLVNPGDIAGLAACVRRFFSLSREERHQMGRVAHAHYLTHFGRGHNLELLTGVYRDAIEANAGRHARGKQHSTKQ